MEKITFNFNVNGVEDAILDFAKERFRKKIDKDILNYQIIRNKLSNIKENTKEYLIDIVAQITAGTNPEETEFFINNVFYKRNYETINLEKINNYNDYRKIEEEQLQKIEEEYNELKNQGKDITEIIPILVSKKYNTKLIKEFIEKLIK